MRYIISDCHLGHNAVSKWRHITKHRKDTKQSIEDYFNEPELMSSEEQHEFIYEGLARIPKKATLFMLGDIAFDKYWLDRIKALQCQNKILILGNHDLDRGNKLQDIIDTYDQVYSLHKYKDHWLSHAPIHPLELRDKFCVHGHSHSELMYNISGVDRRYINVSCEYTGYKPISWEYAISDEYYQECKGKWLEQQAKKVQ